MAKEKNPLIELHCNYYNYYYYMNSLQSSYDCNGHYRELSMKTKKRKANKQKVGIKEDKNFIEGRPINIYTSIFYGNILCRFYSFILRHNICHFSYILKKHTAAFVEQQVIGVLVM
jgi:hypothetical protein